MNYASLARMSEPLSFKKYALVNIGVAATLLIIYILFYYVKPLL